MVDYDFGPMCMMLINWQAVIVTDVLLLQWPDVLALMGDASDNVPGLKGIGPKGALALIQEYGSIDAVLENAGEVRAHALRQ